MPDRIAVLVITRNRANLLARCLASVAGQTHAAAEVVVVDNGSTDDTAAVLSAFTSKLPLRVVYEATPSIPRARNLALRHATTPLAAFLDDDCAADPAWLAAAARVAAERPDAVLVQGRVEGRAQGLVGAAFRLSNELYFDHHCFADRDANVLRYAWTSNLLVRRDVLAELGEAFDETITRSSDRELSARLRRANQLILYQPDMVVTHEYGRPSLIELCAKFFRRARARAGAGATARSRRDEARAYARMLQDLLSRIHRDRSTAPRAKPALLLANGAFLLASGLGFVYWSLRGDARRVRQRLDVT